MSESTLHNWQDLANAIILRAVEDYRQAQNQNRKRPHKSETEMKIQEIEQFFCSEWFCVLTPLDGVQLLHDLKKNITEEDL